MIQKVTTVRLRSTSNPQTHVRFLGHRHMYLRYMSFFQILKSMSILKFTNRRPILKSIAVSHFLKSTSNDVDALIQTLTNKSAIDLKIWKGGQFENILISDRD